jgi:hypothetical protein
MQIIKKFLNEEIQSLIGEKIKGGEVLTIKDKSFDFNAIDGLGELKGISFDNCKFEKGIRISNILDGLFVFFENCEFPRGAGITLENIAVATIQINDSKIKEHTNDEEELFNFKSGIRSETIFFSKVVTDNLIILSSDFNLEFVESAFFKKIKIGGIENKHESDLKRSISFTESEIYAFEMNFIKCILGEFVINECGHRVLSSEIIEKLPEHTYSFFHQSIVETIRMKNSDCTDISFEFENVPIQSIDIQKTQLQKLSCFMSKSKDADDKDRNSLIHKVQISNSEIGALILSGREIDLPLSFSGTTFFEAPVFHGLEIPQGSIFPTVDFFECRLGEETIMAYRTLRLAMEGQRARSEEGMFYALEQESILNTRGPRFKFLTINFWYKLLSDYGTNFKKPFYVLISTLACFCFFYAWWLSPIFGVEHDIDWKLIGNSFLFSFQQSAAPFYFFKDLKPLLERADAVSFLVLFVLKFAAIFQSLISILLLILIAFATNWRFKRG